MPGKPDPRAALRRPFPINPPVHRNLPLADLVRWFQVTRMQRLVWPRLSIAGFRWRRAGDRAHRALAERAAAHIGPILPRCDRCKLAVATRHHIREVDGENLIEHYCAHCAALAPAPWFALVQ